MNDYLSRSPEFDQPQYYRFARQSGIPYGTFGNGRRRHPVRAIVDAIASVVAWLRRGA